MIDKTKNYRIWTTDAFQCEVVFNIIKQLGVRPRGELDEYISRGCVAMYLHKSGNFSFSSNMDRTLTSEENGDHNSYIKMEWFEFFKAYTEGVING